MDLLTMIQTCGTLMTVSGIVLAVLGAIAVAVRFAVRKAFNVKLGADDWWILGAAIAHLVLQGIQGWGALIGRDSVSFEDPKLAIYLKSMYICTMFEYPVIAMSKFSVLCLYRRLFATKSFRNITTAMIAFETAWFIACEVVEATFCLPVESWWDFTIQGNCVNYPVFYLITNIVDIVFDCIVLALPLHQIYKLQMSTNRRVQLMLVFLIGGFTIFANIIRQPRAYIPNSMVLDLCQDTLWMNIYLGVGVICACLPTYRPVMVRTAEVVSTSWNKYVSSRISGSSNSSKNTGSSHNKPASVERAFSKLSSNQGDNPGMQFKNDSDFHYGDQVKLVDMDAKYGRRTG